MWTYLRGLVQPHRQFKMFYDSQYKRILRQNAQLTQMLLKVDISMASARKKLDGLGAKVDSMYKETVAVERNVGRIEDALAEYQEIPTPRLH